MEDESIKVSELGYMGMSVSNAQEWKEYAKDIVGMEIVDEGETDRFYLRMDSWHHRIVVHTTDAKDDLEYLGWRVGDQVELDSMLRKLKSAGVKVRIGTEKEADERHVLGLLKMMSPGGIPNEVFYGPRVDSQKPFHPGRPMHGRFVANNEQGFGHCLVREDDIEAAIKFYRLLGLRGSVEYKIPLPDGNVAKPFFMHCNDRQHSIAFGLPGQKRINHLMIEYTELDDLGIAHDTIRKKKIDVAMQLGKHANDQALTVYCGTPSSWLWELGWGARKSQNSQEYHQADIFGHGVESSGYGLDVDLSTR